LLGSDGRGGGPLGAADGAEEDSGARFGSIEGLGCYGDGVGVDGALSMALYMVREDGESNRIWRKLEDVRRLEDVLGG